jgi:hypothetical protein
MTVFDWFKANQKQVLQSRICHSLFRHEQTTEMWETGSGNILFGSGLDTHHFSSAFTGQRRITATPRVAAGNAGLT